MRNTLIILIICFSLSVAQSQNSLQYYIGIAEHNSPILQKQENEKKLIHLDLKQFNAIYKSPVINLNTNAIFSPIISKDGNSNSFELLSSGSSDYLGYDLGATNGGQFQALISVKQPLFTERYYKAQETNSNILQKRNINSAQLTKAELKQAVTHQYILCVQSQKQKENIQNTIKILNDQIQQMQMLVDAGIYKLIDLKLLEIELANNQIENERLKGRYIENYNALNLVCGIDDTATYYLEDINLDLISNNQRSSLFTYQFKLDSLSVKAQQKVFNLNYLPDVGVFGNAGLNATYQPDLNRLGFSFGIALNWKLFDGHQKQINDQRALIKLSNIETDRNYFKNQNNIRKKNLLRQINNLDNQIKLINNQLADYNELLELYKLEINESLISVLELKTLIREISMKQQAKTNTIMAKEILINSYNYWNL